MTDLLEDDAKRVYGEYDTARRLYESTAQTDPNWPVIKRRFDDAQRVLNETRALWREIGEAAGLRGGAPGVFIRVTDEDDSAPDAPTGELAQERALIAAALPNGDWTERRHYPKGDA